MRIRPDGSIESNNLPQNSDFYLNKLDKNSDTHRGIITKVLYSDNITQNVTAKTENPVVLYEVLVLNGELSGKIFTNVRLSQDLGGSLNYSEKVLRAIDPGIDFSKTLINPLKTLDGDIVLITFLGGDKKSPIIIGLEKSPKNSNTSATAADGPRMIEEYNGIKKEINKDGELILTKKGGLYKDANQGDYFEPNVEANTFEAKFQLLKDQISQFDFGAGEEGQKPVNIQIDAINELITLTFKTGMVLTFDGKNDTYKVETSGGAKIEINGASNLATIEIGSQKIEVTNSEININGTLVNVGTGAAFSATLFENLMIAFNSHFHTGNLGAPTTPPSIPLNTTVGSTSVKIKS